jgi:hypothetical protein
MATTVKVTEKTDDALETLAARVFLKTHRKIPKQELVDILVQLGRDDEDAVVARVLGIRRPIPEAQWRRFLREHVSNWGVATREEDLDATLYGGADD